MRPHRRQPTRLPLPWDSQGKNIGVGCHFLLQCMKVKSESEVAQSCLTLIDPMDCNLPGSSTHGILQTRVLEWVAIAFSCAAAAAPTLSYSSNINLGVIVKGFCRCIWDPKSVYLIIGGLSRWAWPKFKKAVNIGIKIRDRELEIQNMRSWCTVLALKTEGATGQGRSAASWN